MHGCRLGRGNSDSHWMMADPDLLFVETYVSTNTTACMLHTKWCGIMVQGMLLYIGMYHERMDTVVVIRPKMKHV